MLQSLADSTAVAIENIQVLSKYHETIEELKKQIEANLSKVEELKKANLKLEAETGSRIELEKELFESNSRYYTTLWKCHH